MGCPSYSSGIRVKSVILFSVAGAHDKVLLAPKEGAAPTHLDECPSVGEL